ncbi:MAG TPA: hydrogenase maturation protease [Thermomicrobiales bacterium]|nr:hydrogenase maturation protease [Thermomicrobiales bacterium]
MSRILIAGMGNVLRGDDGFGVETAKRLAACDSLGSDARVIEVGIGGIHLVQELMDGYDTLVVIDAVDRGSIPGTIHLLLAEVPDLAEWAEHERRDFLADMHYTTPSKALILARALGVLPAKAYILGCQPAEVDAVGIGLTDPVAKAVSEAVQMVQRMTQRATGHHDQDKHSGPMAGIA